MQVPQPSLLDPFWAKKKTGGSGGSVVGVAVTQVVLIAVVLPRFCPPMSARSPATPQGTSSGPSILSQKTRSEAQAAACEGVTVQYPPFPPDDSDQGSGGSVWGVAVARVAAAAAADAAVAAAMAGDRGGRSFPSLLAKVIGGMLSGAFHAAMVAPCHTCTHLLMTLNHRRFALKRTSSLNYPNPTANKRLHTLLHAPSPYLFSLPNLQPYSPLSLSHQAHWVARAPLEQGLAVSRGARRLALRRRLPEGWDCVEDRWKSSSMFFQK